MAGFSKHTQKPVTVLLDRATCHTNATACDNVKLVFFPTASPELNAAERFFKKLRKELKCRVFHQLEQIGTKIKALWINIGKIHSSL